MPREPLSPGDAVRARVPAVLLSHRENTAVALADGLVERELKERCARCACGDEVTGRTDRERAALAWAAAMASGADPVDELWTALRRHFSEAQLVELGYAVAFVFGQHRVLATFGL